MWFKIARLFSSGFELNSITAGVEFDAMGAAGTAGANGTGGGGNPLVGAAGIIIVEEYY
mgnify:CR=1 FL=1